MTDAPIPPGGVIGVLGGGQLGRMLALAAARLGLKTHVFAPPGDAPAVQVAAAATRAEYDDAAALNAFADAVDVVTIEFENAPSAALARLAERRPVRPNATAAATCQDRLVEKQFLNEAGIATAAFYAVDGADDLRRALEQTDGRGVLKTRRLGYDGKGQARINTTRDIDAAMDAIAGAPAILEAVAPFVREVSVVAARGVDGRLQCYDPAENIHEDGILRESRTPGAAPPPVAIAAQDIAARVLAALDYVGVMGVEMFELPDGRLLVNELAPRPHNSGHWTMEACLVDQFEQQARAVCGWPLGDPTRHSDAVMTNLLGSDADDWAALAADPDVSLHLYGKAAVRPGRKMGHATRLSPRTR